MDNWIFIWLVGLFVMGFIVLIYEYVYPSGEGYTVSSYVQTQTDNLYIIEDSAKFAFKISARLWKVFYGSRTSFIEYHKGE